MSFEKFDNECQGCKPCVLDPHTMKPLPLGDPIMLAVNKVWRDASREEREAFHRFACLNQHGPVEVAIMRKLSFKIQEVCEAQRHN
jgi:hypothetical protein